MQYTLIDTPSALSEYCSKIANASVLAIDTEFVRTRTLIPKLGLVQVYDGQHLGLIDTVSIDDLSPLKALLSDNKVIKVLHSCSEDLEAFFTNLDVVPSPIYDTQVAASMLKMGPSLGYANLIEVLQGVIVDKGESRTDWIARPLSKEQLKYAAADVYYLLPAYYELKDQTDASNKTDLVMSEIAALANKKQTVFPSDMAYLNIKNAWKLRGHSLQALKLMANWRLTRAREKDIAINFVLREQAMVTIAMKLPDHIAQLSNIEGLQPRDIRQHGERLLGFIEQAKALPEQDCPARIKRLLDFKDYKKALSDLKILSDELAVQHDLAVENVASKKQLNQWLKWCWIEIDETHLLGMKPDIISGWRAALFSQKLKVMFNNNSGKYNALRNI